MNKLIMISAAAVLTFGGMNTAVAQGYVREREYRADQWRGRSRIGDELNRLNYRFERVRELLRASGGRHLWSEYGRLSRERDRLNWRIRRNAIDPYRARFEIDRLRDGLRDLEGRARGRGYRQYW